MLFIQRTMLGFRIEIIRFINQRDNKPVIFAVTHIGKWDFEIVNEKIGNHFHVIATDFLNMHGRFSGIFMRSNGVIWVNEHSAEDKHNTKEMMKRVLAQGDNIMIFPEGTWNLSENEIVREIAYGTADVAIQMNVNIIPIAVEQYDKRFVINMGQAIWPQQYDKDKKILTSALRDTLATLKWEIWERQSVQRRAAIREFYWRDFIQERRSEWKGYSMEEQIVNTYIPKEKLEYWQVQRDMRTDKLPLWYRILLEEERKETEEYLFGAKV